MRRSRSWSTGRCASRLRPLAALLALQQVEDTAVEAVEDGRDVSSILRIERNEHSALLQRVAMNSTTWRDRGNLPWFPAQSRMQRAMPDDTPARRGRTRVRAKPPISATSRPPRRRVARPDVNARVRDIGNLAVELVRVLDEGHKAVGPGIRISTRELQVGLRHMMLTRAYDERMQRSQRGGRSRSTCARWARRRCRSLRPWRSGRRHAVPGYRNQGLFIARQALVDLMCSCSRTRATCARDGSSVMYIDRGRIFSIPAT